MGNGCCAPKVINFASMDDAAIKIYGTKRDKNVECVALLSLWNHSIALSPSKYAYLRCFVSADKIHFQKEMIKRLIKRFDSPSDRRLFILSGEIDLDEWKDIMNSLQVSVNYQLWRYATMYEAHGPPFPKRTTKLSGFHTKYIRYSPVDADRHTRTIYILWAPHARKHFSSCFFLQQAPRF